MDEGTNGQMDNPIIRCLLKTFQADGVKMDKDT